MKYTVDESRSWYNKLPAKRSSAGMIVRRGDMVLMVKDDYKPAMTFPGGVIDPDEAPRHAAVRETAEETGLQLTEETVEFFTMAYVPEKDGFLDRYHFFFYVRIADEIDDVVHDASIEYVQWVPIDAIAEKAGNRPTYIAIQHMLQTGETQPYFEIAKGKEAPKLWQT